VTAVRWSDPVRASLRSPALRRLAGLAPRLAAGLAPRLAAGLAPRLAAGLAPRLAAGFVAGLAAAGLLVACTSSGDGGRGDIDSVLQSGATYVSSRPSSQDVDVVYLTQVTSARDVLCLDVEVGRVSDLYALAFELEYDADVLSFREYVEGTFFGVGGQTLEEVSRRQEPARGLEVTVVGVSRVGDVPGITGCSSSSVCATARGPAITLCWDVLAPGTTALTFAGNLGGFPPGSVDPADRIIVDSGFHGGTVTAQ
jgi:hypothetical protein